MENSCVILYFGSFNPIHNGHLSVARHLLAENLCDEVWFVVSPNNPLKKSDDLLEETKRLEMVQIAIGEENQNIKVSDIEFHLTKPSYTINTLNTLSGEYPHIEFSLLMGEDNIFTFQHWKNWIEIATKHKIFIYPRVTDRREIVNQKISELCNSGNLGHNPFNYLSDAPQIDISSTKIRNSIENGELIDNYTTTEVSEYIKKNKLYETNINKK